MNFQVKKTNGNAMAGLPQEPMGAEQYFRHGFVNICSLYE